MDRYHIYEAIGRGKHSVVYKGRRKKTVQYYAIKSVEKSQRPRVLQEVQVLRAVSHELVLKFHAWYETQNHLWLILEYCVGGDLLSLLRQDLSLPQASIGAFGADLVVSLRTLHRHGHVHCDLKPSNVLIDEDGRLKLCGFGLARRVADVQSSRGTPSQLARRGTPCYMAPELFSETHGLHSYASDLYALGCVLYECACGQPPFVSSSLSALIGMILEKEPPRFDPKIEAKLSPAFVDLVFGLLRKNPSSRLRWDDVLNHAFWRECGRGSAPQSVDVASAIERVARADPPPPQPAFEAVERSVALADRLDAAATVSSPRSSRGGVGSPSPSPGAATASASRSKARRDDVARLSVAARINLEREEGGAYADRDDKSDKGGAGGGDDDDVARRPKAAARAAAAGGDVELANPDAELNFGGADADAGDASRPDSGRPKPRPLSGREGDGDSTVATMTRTGSNLDGRERRGREEEEEDEENEMVADPGTESAAAAVAAERSAAAAEEEETRRRRAEQFSTSSASTAKTPGKSYLTPRSRDARPAVGATPGYGGQTGGSGLLDRGEPNAPLPATTPMNLPRRSRTDDDDDDENSPSRENERADRGLDLRTPSKGGAGGSGTLNPKPPAAPPATDAGAALESIASLMHHATDSAIKPIVLNRRIEVLPEPMYDPAGLPFPALTVAQMLSSSQTDLEAFLTHIYRSVAHSSPINEKVNTLSYFETLCVDTAAANVLINSSLMTLFVRMLRASKAPMLRIRLTSCMGLLLRHATYITEELSGCGVVTVLTECLKDKNERVRRRAMATLGELLFYIATQQHEASEAAKRGGRGASNGKAGAAEPTGASPSASAWAVPASTVGTVARLLRAGEDEIAQHYAVKTIENITSHGGEWAAKFASAETTASLVAIMSSAKSEQLRGTAASCLARAARHTPSTLQTVLDRHGVKLLVTGLRDPSPKVQQAALCLLCQGLGDLGARARAALAAEDKTALLPTLVGLLERGSAVLRGKALLTLALLFRLHPRWLLAACQTKLLPLIDRLQKDKEPYLERCLEACVGVVVALAPKVNEAVLSEIDRLTGSTASAAGRPGSAGGWGWGGDGGGGTRPGSRGGGGGGGAAGRISTPPGGERNKPGPALSLFPILVHLLGSAVMRPRICDARMLADVASFLAAADGGASFPGRVEFRGGALTLLETLSQCAPSVLAVPDAAIEHLLPALADMLGKPDSSADGRFLALKLTCDTLLPLALDPEKTDGGGGGGGGSSSNTSTRRALLSSLLREKLLPLCPTLLADEDPIPLYALKLLGGALEADRGMCEAVVELGLAPKFFEFLSLEHTNNNVHNVRLCLVLAASRAVPTRALCEFDAGAKVAAVLSYAHENAVEPFMEPALGIARAMLARAADASRSGDETLITLTLKSTAPLLELAPVFVECASAGETEVASFAVPQLAAAALALMVESRPREASAATFHPRSPLVAAVEAMGTRAATERGERGFAEVSVPCDDMAPSVGAADVAFAHGMGSPRAGFARAQRTALGAIAAAARGHVGPPPEGGEAPALASTLRKLARGEPCAGIAAAAAAAADSVAALVARGAAR